MVTNGQLAPDWTFTPAPVDSGFYYSPRLGFTGGGSATFEGTGGTPYVDDDTISQTLATTPGDDYAISYYLYNTAGPSNNFQGYFGGQEFNSVLNAQLFDYTQFTATEEATSGSTMLEFAGRSVPGGFRLSDISVTDLGPAVATSVPEPSSFALLGLCLPGVMLLARKRHSHTH